MGGMKNTSMLVGLTAAALAVAPVASAEAPMPDGKDYPLAEGHYTTEADPGWVFFVVDFGGKPADYHDYFGCGVGPDGTVGCDRAPAPTRYRSLDATYPPAGSNQTVADANEAASYRFSLTPAPNAGAATRVRCRAGRASTASCSRLCGVRTGS
jgi:hypothetical protein